MSNSSEIVTGKFWTPVRCKPRQEKKLLQYCHGKGIAAYLPVRKKVRFYGKRKREFELPMLPGYVFCRISAGEVVLLRQSDAMIYVIPVDGFSEVQLRRELRDLHAFERLSWSCRVDVRPELASGTPVEVTAGALRGCRGVVVKRKNRSVLVINIELLGQSVEAEIEAEKLSIE